MKTILLACAFFSIAVYHCSNCSSPNTGDNFDDDCDNEHPAEDPRAQGYVDVAIKEHNNYRSKHGAPKVTQGDADINNHAQNWADHLAKTDPKNLIHSDTPYGENLYRHRGSDVDKNSIMTKAIKSWYDENKDYDYNNPGFSILLATSLNLCGSRLPDKKYKYRAVVCINYNPAGNVQGQFKQNVLPPKK